MNRTPPIARFNTSRVLRRRMAYVLANEVVARHRRELAFPHVAQRWRICAMRMATVVLPVPGFPVNDMWRGGSASTQPEIPTHPVDEQERGNIANAALHRHEPYQLAVELLENLTDVGLPEHGVEIESRGGPASTGLHRIDLTRIKRCIHACAPLNAASCGKG